MSPTVAATVGFHDKVYCLCTICSIVDPPNVVKPHNSSYLMAGCYNLLTGFHSVKQTFYSCCKRKEKEKWRSLALYTEQYVLKAKRAL